jgi:tetratricopeptide (TPR) repeat protein
MLARVESTTPIDVTLGALMLRAACWRALVIAAVVLALRPAAEAAPANEDARRTTEEATAAFGLGRYAEAAQRYEAAFALRPDPALLYDAAQAYRLAGSKARALELYRNYGRLYPDGRNAGDARSHVAALQKAIEDERPPTDMARPPGSAAPPSAGAPQASGTVAPLPASPASPPDGRPMPPPVETPMPVAPLPAAAPAPGNANLSLVARPRQTRANEKKSVTQQTWFWVAVGVGAAIVATTAIVLATRSDQYPDPTFGTARGN